MNASMGRRRTGSFEFLLQYLIIITPRMSRNSHRGRKGLIYSERRSSNTGVGADVFLLTLQAERRRKLT